MTDTPRDLIAGKLGRKPARHVPELELERFRTQARADVPASGDVSRGITSWLMLGNDQYGDCGPAATEHFRMSKGLYSGDETPTEAETVALYFDYGIAQGEPPPQPDEGVENATWLAWLFAESQSAKLAGDDIDEFAYAEVNISSVDNINSAMLEFNGVLCGVNLTDYDEQDFPNVPWGTQTPVQPNPQLGHDIVKVRFGQSGPAGDTYVTWGALQQATTGWSSACIDEAWVIVTREDAENAGIDFDALLAECTALGGGQVVPTPAPTPPAPTPTPTPPSPTPPTVAWRSVVEADVNAMQSAREDLDGANAVVANSALTVAEKESVHVALARAAGVLQTTETADRALLNANPS